MYHVLQNQRYLQFRIRISKFNWISTILFDLFDDRFRKFVRMNRNTFKKMFEIIENDSIFYNNSYAQQTFVNFQFSIVLHKLNHDNIECDYKNVANIWKVSKNHVYDCTKKIILTLNNKKNQYVKWFDVSKRRYKNIKNDYRAKFIDYINKMNNIDVFFVIKSKNIYDKKIFFNRKKRYIMNLCIVCDFKKKFIYMFIDWFNFQHDVRIWFTTNFNKRFKKYFDH